MYVSSAQSPNILLPLLSPDQSANVILSALRRYEMLGSAGVPIQRGARVTCLALSQTLLTRVLYCSHVLNDSEGPFIAHNLNAGR